jgi:hypothetical protein
VLARKVDHIICEPQRDFIERQVSELDVPREHDIAVSIIAFEGSGIAGADAQRSHLRTELWRSCDRSRIRTTCCISRIPTGKCTSALPSQGDC